jgi:hypothetical protein
VRRPPATRGPSCVCHERIAGHRLESVSKRYGARTVVHDSPSR